jgi:hypothetical protein
LSVHARYDGDVCSDVGVYCEGVGEGAGMTLLFDVFNTTGADYGGFHYDPLVHVDGTRRDVAVVLCDGEEDEVAVSIAVVAASGDVTPDVVMHCGGAMDEEFAGESGAVPSALPPPAFPKERRVLRRRDAMHVLVPGLDDLRTALRRLSLGTPGDAVDSVVSDTELESPGSVSEGAMAESVATAFSGGCSHVRVVVPEFFCGPADLAASGVESCSSRPAQKDVVVDSSRCGQSGKVVESAAMSSSPDGAEPGVVAPGLFAGTSIAEENCRARIYSEKTLPVLFSQCDKRAKIGRFCKRHADFQPQGVWDPPLHANLPAGKLEEARHKVVRWRAQTVTSSVPSATVKGGGRGAKRGVRPLTEPVISTDAASVLVEPASGSRAEGVGRGNAAKGNMRGAKSDARQSAGSIAEGATERVGGPDLGEVVGKSSFSGASERRASLLRRRPV